MKKLSTLVFAVVFALTGVVGFGGATAKEVKPLSPIGARPDIHLKFDNQSFSDSKNNSTVKVPLDGGTGNEACLSGSSYEDSTVTICNDPTESQFGTDVNGSYWKTVKNQSATSGGLLIDPNNPITDEYTIAVTFSLVEDLETDYDGYTRVITQSAVRESNGKMLDQDCGTYLENELGTSNVHPSNYCPDGMFDLSRHVDVSAESSEVITLVITHNSENKLCLYEIEAGGVATRLGSCGTDSDTTDDADSQPDQINDGMIGFFMDDNGEVPISAKIYDIRIWDQPLNLRQLDAGYITPGIPRDVTVKKTGAKTQVSWKNPSSGPVAKSYVATAYTSESGDEIAATCVKNNGLTCKMQLTPGTYWISVAAKNSDGIGIPSARVAFSVVPRG